MKICHNCFNDIELRSIIDSNKKHGVCDICNKKAIIYDTDDNYLIDVLDDFLNMYKKVDDSVPSKHRLSLENELINQWNIFSKSCTCKVKDIVSAIYKDVEDRFDISMFDGEVYIPQTTNSEYLQQHSILKNCEWKDFVDEIKHKNRYHSTILNKEKFNIFLDSLKLDLRINEYFSRARISTYKGHKKSEMGMPPDYKARAGRIGADGIACFYLASDIDTAIKEVRAGAFDYVTVAKYKLKKEIRVIDLRRLDNISPFAISDPVWLAINKNTFKKIKEEVEKPVRLSENTIEYVPIQYICDYIRSKGYAGIIYNSTMCSKGYNLSAFSDCCFKFMRKRVYYIKNLTIDWEIVKN